MTDKLKTCEFTIETIVKKDKFYVLRNNGDGYFVWEPELKHMIRDGEVDEGDTVKLEYIPGEYPKVKDIEVLKHGSSSPDADEDDDEKYSDAHSQGNKSLRQFMKSTTDDVRETHIVRGCALKCAIDSIGELHGGDDKNIYAKMVTDLAFEFEQWILCKDEPKGSA